jgi:STE24 endopeptidase
MITIHTATAVLLFTVCLSRSLSVAAHLLDRRRLPEKPGDKEFAYQRERCGFAALQETVSTSMLLLFWLFGGFSYIARLALEGGTRLGGGSASAALIFGALLFLLSVILGIPFQLYSTFSIEERYGYNKSSLKTFLADLVKMILLTILIGAPLFLLVHAFYLRIGPSGWLAAWGAYTAFSLLLTFIAPRFIMPLFNRFSPMEEGSLRNSLMALAEKAGVSLKSVEVIDGSRRSTKANAFVAGFGKGRRVALFDTFLEERPEDQVLAVSAHEFGHIVHRHVVKQIVFSALFSIPIFYLLFRLVESPALVKAFGLQLGSPQTGGIALILLVIAAGFFSELLTPLFNLFSRKREYQSDAFARKMMGTGEPLVKALKALEEKNGGHPDPHPLSVALRYSHPPVAMRVSRLQQ